ncbi:cysteine desulfurase-like protein [Thalassotalea sp. G20_0]|uniref:cysteine desulfurase-like protein n=1 Tax=Thalassotalea sp. G20_0 TaxID=2821093 RepID=UPI001ADBBCE1|nr:cysteine desulfurase-like protein [Thalassotalea sp. G20_0]
MEKQHNSTSLQRIREQFPALERLEGNQRAVYSDAPGGTQVPVSVISAMSDYQQSGSANLGGFFATSEETMALLERAREAAGQLLNAPADSIAFGANMTSLTLALSRAIARTWHKGDEIVVSSLDHDANITPWVLAAEERGCTVRTMDFTASQNLCVTELERLLSDRTRLVAFTLASNVTGSITPASELIRAAHSVNALVHVDAVHYTAHRLPDVQALNVDFLTCSAYKFCGPYLGVMYGRPELLGSLKPYKVRAANDQPPWCWETGTQNFTAIAGLLACIQYHGWLTGSDHDRKGLQMSASWIEEHEQQLSQRFLDGLKHMTGFTLYGSDTTVDRTPTFALAHHRQSSARLAQLLARQGIYTWSGHFYALDLLDRLKLQERDGLLRIGFVHYHTPEEIDRVLNVLADISA